MRGWTVERRWYSKYPVAICNANISEMCHHQDSRSTYPTRHSPPSLITRERYHLVQPSHQFRAERDCIIENIQLSVSSPSLQGFNMELFISGAGFCHPQSTSLSSISSSGAQHFLINYSQGSTKKVNRSPHTAYIWLLTNWLEPWNYK